MRDYFQVLEKCSVGIKRSSHEFHYSLISLQLSRLLWKRSIRLINVSSSFAKNQIDWLKCFFLSQPKSSFFLPFVFQLHTENFSSHGEFQLIYASLMKKFSSSTKEFQIWFCNKTKNVWLKIAFHINWKIPSNLKHCFALIIYFLEFL